MLGFATRTSRAVASSPSDIADEKRRASNWGQSRIAIGTNRDLSDSAAASDAANCSVVIINVYDTAYLAKLKALNPTIQVGAYKNIGAMRSSLFPDGSTSTFVSLGVADPSWQLYNGTTALYYTSYPALFAADIGLHAYLDAGDAVSGAEVASRGFDFIFLDNVDPRLPTQLTSDLYPTDAAYQAAVLAGINYVVPKLKARGLWVLPNIGGWHDSTIAGAVSNGNAVAAQCGAGLHEQWASFGIPPTLQSGGSDDTGIISAQTLQKNGGRHVSISHGAVTDTNVARLALAMELLVQFGYLTAVTGQMPNTTYESLPAYGIPTDVTNAKNLGVPTEDATQVQAHVWRRTFANGQVWVNTSTSTHAVTFGGTYSGDGLVSQTGTTLATQSGLILTAG